MYRYQSQMRITAMLGIVLATCAVLLAEGQSPLAAQDQASTRLKVPAGFSLNLYASGLSNPRFMTIGPDGALYVADRGASAIVRLVDSTGSGVADQKQVVASGANLHDVHSVEWYNGWLYAATGTAIWRFKNQDANGKFQAQQQVVANLPTPIDHISRTLHFGPDGMMYVAVGSSSNIGIDSDIRHATIMRFTPDGAIPSDNPYANDSNPNRRPIWAQGLRNSVDFVFMPDGQLWANMNGSDSLGDDIPPEVIVVHVEAGKDYGWPYCYTPVLGVVPADTVDAHDPRIIFGGRLTSCAQATPALFTDLAHSAPLGMAYYDKTAFPDGYRGNLFVAYHGSWNSSQPRDCRVQMIVIQNGLPVSASPFVTGFRDSDQQQCAAAWGRPAGVTVGPNGELFVSDDQNGNIYRIIYSGT